MAGVKGFIGDLVCNVGVGFAENLRLLCIVQNGLYLHL
jgi:hypothetical protein